MLPVGYSSVILWKNKGNMSNFSKDSEKGINMWRTVFNSVKDFYKTSNGITGIYFMIGMVWFFVVVMLLFKGCTWIVG